MTDCKREMLEDQFIRAEGAMELAFRAYLRAKEHSRAQGLALGWGVTADGIIDRLALQLAHLGKPKHVGGDQ